MVDSLSGLGEVSEKKQVISFDLFDTLVYRSDLNSEQIIMLACQYAASQIKRLVNQEVEPSQILIKRKTLQASLKSVPSFPTEEPTLVRVYVAIFRAFGVSGHEAIQASKLVCEFELTMELEGLRLYEDSMPLLNRFADNAKTLVVTSDMYYDELQVRWLLRNLGVEPFFKHVLVSSSFGKKKESGSLFRALPSLLEVKPEDILHIGDNKYSDVYQSVKTGIDAVYVDRKPETGKGRVEGKNNDSECLDSIVLDVFLSFVARIAMWARQDGVARLYFLARDATGIKKLVHDCRAE